MSRFLQVIRKAPLVIQSCRTVAVTNVRYKRKKPTIELDPAEVLKAPSEFEEKLKLRQLIEAPEISDVSRISGVPEELLRCRRVRIHMPTKNAMQSGTNNINCWQIEFDCRERWENPLMGWASTGDPLSNMQLNFGSQAEAIEYCEKNGWRWHAEEPRKPKKQREKNYGINFAYGKRTRVSTK